MILASDPSIPEINLHDQYISLIFNGVSDALFLVRVEAKDTFRVLEVNQSYLDATGFQKEEVLHKLVEEVLEGEAAAFVIRKYQEAISKKHPFQYEETVNLPSGRCVFEIKLTPVCSTPYKCTHLLGAMRDITERKKAEELLRKTGMLSAVGQLAASIAHEIRNPLTALKGFVQLLDDHCNKKDYLNIMKSELERIESILNELLFLSKPNKGEFMKTDIVSVIKQIIDIIHPQALLNNVTIHTEIEKNLPSIFGDQKQLKQVFINILKNAMEGMPSGGNIYIQLFKNPLDQLVARIIDQGIGIPEEVLAKLGEAFFTTKEKGTGLGLMISSEIIQNHQGALTIHSELNKGTTVEIVLPILEKSKSY